MPSPNVSIIIPVYNVEKYIHRCIDSVLSQTFTDFECILVDDCSPDKCPEICDDYAKQDTRIKVIHKAQNEGLPQARKTGFDISSGKYIIHIDGDDYIEVDMLEKMYSKASSQNHDMVYCDFYKHDKADNVLYKKAPALSDNFVMNVRCCTLSFGTGYVWNKLIKRAIYEKVEFPTDGYLEDSYITTQTLFFSKNIGYVDVALYHYLYNQLSYSHHWKREWNRCKEGKNNLEKLSNFLKKNNGEDLSVFEPELTKKINWIKNKRKEIPKKIIKKIVLFPIKLLGV